MVVQLPSLQKNELFVTSDQANKLSADAEVAHWASDHGYRLPQTGCTFAIFENGSVVREWALVERVRRAAH